jgi:hypothetical protein
VLEACRIFKYVGDESPQKGLGLYGSQGFAVRTSRSM